MALPLEIARTADGRAIVLLPSLANRHGLITGATGTGKTVTLQLPEVGDPEKPRPRGGRHEGMLESAARSAARSVGSGLGRQVLRGVLGSMFGGRR